MATQCYCASLRAAARRVSAIYDEALAPAGINVGQLSMLRAIERTGAVSLTGLGQACELDRSTVGRNARVLERRALVRPAAGRDHRQARLELTDAGRHTLTAAAPLWEGAQRKVEHDLGEGEAVRLRSLLQSL
jgi:DNA-binding MarR family transcriptional regulator